MFAYASWSSRELLRCHVARYSICYIFRDVELMIARVETLICYVILSTLRELLEHHTKNSNYYNTGKRQRNNINTTSYQWNTTEVRKMNKQQQDTKHTTAMNDHIDGFCDQRLRNVSEWSNPELLLRHVARKPGIASGVMLDYRSICAGELSPLYTE